MSVSLCRNVASANQAYAETERDHPGGNIQEMAQTNGTQRI